MRKCGEANGDRFTLAAKIDQCEREEGTYGAVEFVAGGVKLRSE